MFLSLAIIGGDHPFPPDLSGIKWFMGGGSEILYRDRILYITLSACLPLLRPGSYALLNVIISLLRTGFIMFFYRLSYSLTRTSSISSILFILYNGFFNPSVGIEGYQSYN